MKCHYITVTDVKTTRKSKTRTKLWCSISSELFAKKGNINRHIYKTLYKKMIRYVEAKNNSVTAEGSSSETFPSPILHLITQTVSQPRDFVCFRTTQVTCKSSSSK